MEKLIEKNSRRRKKTLNNMKSALGIILISAIFTTAVLGAFTIHMDSGSHIRCPIAAFQGNNCTNISNPLEFTISHISAILGISIGVIVPPIVFLLFAFGIFFAFFAFDSAPPRFRAFTYSQYTDGNRQNISQQKWLRWFSVLEKRDPSEFFAAKG